MSIKKELLSVNHVKVKNDDLIIHLKCIISSELVDREYGYETKFI